MATALVCALALGPPAALAAFPGDPGRIAYVAPGGDEETTIQLVTPEGEPRGSPTSGEQPSWSADGRRLAFDVDGFLGFQEGGSTYGISRGSDEEARDPAWSPSGSQLAIVLSTRGSRSEPELATIEVRRTAFSPDTATRFPGVGFDVTGPSWSPDGRLIAFSAVTRGLRQAISTIEPDGTNVRVPTAPGQDEADSSPDWSPDGCRLVYVRRDGASGTYALRAVEADGSADRTLLASAEPLGSPVWSPDGSRLAYVAGSPVGSVNVVNADGTGARALPGTAAVDRGLSWEPLIDDFFRTPRCPASVPLAPETPTSAPAGEAVAARVTLLAFRVRALTRRRLRATVRFTLTADALVVVEIRRGSRLVTRLTRRGRAGAQTVGFTRRIARLSRWRGRFRARVAVVATTAMPHASEGGR